MNLIDRYQNQTKIIKILRWLRWKPFYSLKAIWSICRWIYNKRPIPIDECQWYKGSSEYMYHIWFCYMSVADFKMSHYYTLDEAFDN